MLWSAALCSGGVSLAHAALRDRLNLTLFECVPPAIDALDIVNAHIVARIVQHVGIVPSWKGEDVDKCDDGDDRDGDSGWPEPVHLNGRSLPARLILLGF